MAVGWYLRFSLSYRDVEELVRERGLSVDHVTVWRWVQHFAPEIDRRLRPHLKPTNKSWRVDETYIRVKGKWTYLYRAVDSTGARIDFLLSARRDAAAAKRFFQKVLRSPNHPTPRVINVDKNPSYPPVVEELKSEGTLRRRCQLRPVQYLNNIVEQDHRAIKRRVRASQGFRSFWGAWRTIQGYEVDLSPILRQTVKTQISLKGELSHGIVSKAVHQRVQTGRRAAAGTRGIDRRSRPRAGGGTQRPATLAAGVPRGSR